jgi:hypothetical protein
MKRERILLYFLALLKVILPYLIQNPIWEPHRDELLYLAEARHMAWGYMEAPPLLSLFAWFTNHLGGSLIVIKLWPALFGGLTFLLTGRIILSLGGRWFALLLGWLPFVFGAYLRMEFLFQANFLDIFFWTSMAYGLIRFQQTGKTVNLYLAGISLGLGMLSKYTIAFYATGLIGGLLLTWDKKTILKNRHFYYGLALGLVIWLPNLIWEISHGLPIVYHMRTLEGQQLKYNSAIGFLKGQLLLQLPAILVWVTGLCRLAFTNEGKSFRFIAWAFAITLFLLALGHAKDYYSQGAYPVLIAFGAAAIEAWTAKWKTLGVLLRSALIASTLYIGYFFLTLSLPFLPPADLAAFYARTSLARNTGSLRWEDNKVYPLPQDFADMLSWQEMTRKVANVYAHLDSSERRHTLLFCDNYGEAGAVNYYGTKYHLPTAYSDAASFLYWMPDNFSDLDNLLLVTDDHQEMQHPFVKEFNSAVLEDSVTNPLAREYGTYIILFKGSNARFRQQFRDKIEADKNKTDIRRHGPRTGPI